MYYYQFTVVYFPSLILASWQSRVRVSDIPVRFSRLFDRVYAGLLAVGIEQSGHNHVLYDQFSPDGMRMRVGVPVVNLFEDRAEIKRFEFTGGRAAHTQHRGSYSHLHQAQHQLNLWCGQKSAEAAGLSWEVYGDWSDAIDNLVTDVYILLK